MALLTATDLVKSYARSGQADTVVLRSVSCSIDKGEFVAIVGPSGAGKSTFLHIMASLDKPDSGSVVLHTEAGEKRYDRLSPSDLAALRNASIGIVYQFHHLLPEFSALENVMMPALIGGVSVKTAQERAMQLLERVHVAHRADHRPAELSGGEQQRVAIARALMNDPLVLFADEPTGNLDSANATAIIQLLHALQRDHAMACVIATHSEELAAAAGRVIHMRDGVIL